MQNELHLRLASGVGWTAIATVASRGSLLLALLVTARILGSAEYGMYAIIQSSITFLEVFALAGMGVTASKHIAAFKKKDSRMTGEFLTMTIGVAWILGSAFSVTMALFSSSIADEILNHSELESALRIGAVVLLFNVVNGALIGVITGYEAFREMARLNFVSGFFTLLAIPVGAYFSGVNGALLGWLIATMFMTILNSYVVASKSRQLGVRLLNRISKDTWRVLWRFSLPAILAGMLVAPVMWLANTLLVNTPNGYAEMGVFAAANQWFAILLFLPSMVTNALLPVFSEYAGEKNHQGVRKAVMLGVKVNLLAALPFALVVAAGSPLIMDLYGPGFSGRWDVLVLVCFAALMASTNSLVGNYFLSNNKVAMHLVSNLIWALCFILSAWWLLDQTAGAFALAIALLLAYTIKTAAVLKLATIQLKSEQP